MTMRTHENSFFTFLQSENDKNYNQFFLRERYPQFYILHVVSPKDMELLVISFDLGSKRNP